MWVLPGVNWPAGRSAWGGLFYVPLFSQLIGFFAWNKGLAFGGVAKVSLVKLFPTFVTLLAAAILQMNGWDPLEMVTSLPGDGTIHTRNLTPR